LENKLGEIDGSSMNEWRPLSMSEGVRNEKTSKKRRENAELFFPAPRDVPHEECQ
jgi:hypothetical protein